MTGGQWKHCPIKKGEVLTEQNLTVKRPGTGISPMRWEEVIGTFAVRDFAEEESVEVRDVMDTAFYGKILDIRKKYRNFAALKQ